MGYNIQQLLGKSFTSYPNLTEDIIKKIFPKDCLVQFRNEGSLYKVVDYEINVGANSFLIVEHIKNKDLVRYHVGMLYIDPIKERKRKIKLI